MRTLTLVTMVACCLMLMGGVAFASPSTTARATAATSGQPVVVPVPTPKACTGTALNRTIKRFVATYYSPTYRKNATKVLEKMSPAKRDALFARTVVCK